MAESRTVNRLDRRKAQTRAALVSAARDLLTSRDPAEVSIQEITDAADVGFGVIMITFAIVGGLLIAQILPSIVIGLR